MLRLENQATLVQTPAQGFALYRQLRWHQLKHRGALVLSEDQIAFVSFIEPLLRKHPFTFGLPFFVDCDNTAVWFDNRYVEWLEKIPEFGLIIGYYGKQIHSENSASAPTECELGPELFTPSNSTSIVRGTSDA